MPDRTLFVLRQEDVRQYLTPEKRFTSELIDARLFFSIDEAQSFLADDPTLFHSLYLSPLVEETLITRR